MQKHRIVYTVHTQKALLLYDKQFTFSLFSKRKKHGLHIALCESFMDIHFMTAGSWVHMRFHFIFWIHILIRLVCICLISEEVLKTTVIFPNLVHTLRYAKNFNMPHNLHFTVRVNRFCTQNPCLLLSM